MFSKLFSKNRKEKPSEPINKYEAELTFRKNVIHKYIQWYNGEIDLYGEKPPADNQKIKIGTLTDSAILTWLEVHQKPKYMEGLQLEVDVFSDMKLLDIGSAAVPSGLVFKNCELYCFDPLLPEFMKLGFPFWHYENRAKFVYGYSENMPFPDNYFDAIISLNALDHVDDFEKTAQEINRVLKRNGKIRFHLHYHQETPTEPLVLNDERVFNAFSWCSGFRKINEITSIRNIKLSDANEKYVLWSNF